MSSQVNHLLSLSIAEHVVLRSKMWDPNYTTLSLREPRGLAYMVVQNQTEAIWKKKKKKEMESAYKVLR